MLLAQQASTEPSLFGWYLGLAIAFAVILVVVVLVATILTLALRIGKQANEAISALNDGRINTLPLWDVEKTNKALKGILESAQSARGALQGG